jgi:DNA-binding transcriptional ArsR family regulator
MQTFDCKERLAKKRLDRYIVVMTDDQTDAAGPPPAQGAPSPRVLDAGALRALSHPLRIRMFDLLSQRGPQTASSLAELVGESTGSTSYHLRALAKHDLIREVEGRGTARERWWERPRGSVVMGDPEVVRSPSGRAASQFVATEIYRQRNDQMMRFLEASGRLDPDESVATLLTATTRLTRAQFDEISERLQAVIDDAVDTYRDQEGDGVETYSLRVDLIPVALPHSRTTRTGES